MTELYYDKKVKCLYCHKDFNTLRVRQRQARFIKRDSDYCPHYERENPLLYEVYVCPKCGFAFTDNFSEIKDSKHEILKKIYIKKMKTIPRLNKERNLADSLTAYKLALVTANLLDESNLVIANLALRIAWINRYLNNNEEEKRFLKNTLDVYLEIYNIEDLEQLSMDKYLLIYLIGELYGRLGEINKTRRWFSFIIEDRNSTPKILRFTKDRWYEYKEMLGNKI